MNQILTVLTFIAFAIREAPEVLNVLISLLKIITPDDVDAKLDKFNKDAAIKLNILLKTARSTSRAVADLNFGKVIPAEISDARFDDVFAAVKAEAEALNLTLNRGRLETIAQNGYLLEQIGGADASIKPDGQGEQVIAAKVQELIKEQIEQT